MKQGLSTLVSPAGRREKRGYISSTAIEYMFLCVQVYNIIVHTGARDREQLYRVHIYLNRLRG